VLREHRVDRSRGHVPLDAGIRGTPTWSPRRQEILAKPPIEWNTEASLAAGEDLGGQQIGHGNAQDALE